MTSEPEAASAAGATLRLGRAGADDAAPRAACAGVAPWGSGAAVVVGTPHRLAAPWTALVNGTAAHAPDYDDVLEIGNAHASAILVPALLALGEERGAGGGACARLLRLDATRATAALSLATSLASGAKRQFGTMAKPLHAGLAAKNGIVAATLAEAGIGAAADAYEGERGFVDLFAGVPRAAGGGGGGFPGPARDRAPRALAEGLSLLRQRPTDRSMPCSISMRKAACACRRWPRSARCCPRSRCRTLPYADPVDAMHAQARFSLPYLLASALVDGRLALDAFTATALARPSVRALLPRIHIHPDPAQPGSVDIDEAPQRATVTLRLRGGGARGRCASPGDTRTVRSAGTHFTASSWTAPPAPCLRPRTMPPSRLSTGSPRQAAWAR